MKTISVNNDYREVVFEYTTEDGKTLPILFREWFAPPRIQARFDDNFALANGYPDISTMVEQTVGIGKMLLMFGEIPQWIDTTRQGEFFFIGRNNNLNLN